MPAALRCILLLAFACSSVACAGPCLVIRDFTLDAAQFSNGILDFALVVENEDSAEWPCEGVDAHGSIYVQFVLSIDEDPSTPPNRAVSGWMLVREDEVLSLGESIEFPQPEMINYVDPQISAEDKEIYRYLVASVSTHRGEKKLSNSRCKRYRVVSAVPFPD